MNTLQFIKEKGKDLDVDAILRQVRFWLNDVLNGDYTLILERTKKPRSGDQNRLMWVWFTCIAKNLSEATGRGYTRQNIHDYFCVKFIPETVNGVNVPGKTSKLTQEQMTEFLNNVQAEAADYGITLLSINDPDYYLWSRQYEY